MNKIGAWLDETMLSLPAYGRDMLSRDRSGNSNRFDGGRRRWSTEIVEARVNIEHYKQRLLEREQELEARLGRETETARDARDDQGDVADLGHVAELKDAYFTLAETDSAILAEVRAALSRIDAGTFGLCVVDGRPIEEKRLDAVPWTPYCLNHQQELEQQRPQRTPTL